MFDSLVIKELGLDRYPFLRDDYFHNYRRLVYLAQTEPSEDMLTRARAASVQLDLPLEVRITGMGDLETRLLDLLAA